MKNFQSKYRREGEIITKKQKVSIIIFIIILISTLFIASIATYEKKSMYSKRDNETYIIKTVERIQPFNFDYGYGVVIWCISFAVILIILYICLKRKIKREYNINIVQKIILAITVPLIIFIIALGIDIGEDIWFLWVILLIIVTIFEYDLFGNRKIISAIINIDFKTFVKIGLVLIVLFFAIGTLGYNIKSFFKVSSSRTTELIYNLHQKDNYSGGKFDIYLKEKPGNWLLNIVCSIMNR